MVGVATTEEIGVLRGGVTGGFSSFSILVQEREGDGSGTAGQRNSTATTASASASLSFPSSSMSDSNWFNRSNRYPALGRSSGFDRASS